MSLRPLMKSNGGARGGRDLPDRPLPDLPPVDEQDEPESEPRGWVSVAAALPPPVPGYRASWGCPVRTGDGPVGYGHWRPAGSDARESWSAAWTDGAGHPLEPQPTHWWRG